ncbi:MAG TPA: EamA family transporter RarD [Stellaceae bacterium]|jgi:chloramphenicol-sensitive protein RarD|nr:EamA family transporter RarD [Stellaceae bacterium]
MTDAAPAIDTQASRTRLGLMLGLGSAIVWGLLPGYFEWLREVPPEEVVAHRIAWSMAILVVLVPAMGQLGALRRVFSSPMALGTLTLTAALIALNWIVYISSVQTGHIVEAGLGYYILPLMNVLFGRLILGERLTRWQVAACWLAALSVAWFGWAVGSGVGRALILAVTFGLYGLLRKVVKADAIVGLTVECIVLSPFAVAYLVYLGHVGSLHLHAATPGITILLIGTGAVTALPLLAYSAAARMMKLSTLGVLMYIYPTIQVLIGVWAYGEPFDSRRLLAFIGIWTALAIYTAGSRRPA